MEKLSNNLFLLVANLSQRKDKQAIIRLFIQGLNSFMPEIYFSWRQEARKDAIIEVSTQKKTYGEIEFSEESLSNDPIAMANIQNAAQMLAVILERLEQEQLLNNEKKHLENLVQERTAQLKIQVEEYETLYEEYKALNDQLKETLDKIEKSEDQLRSILENSSNVFYRHDTQHRLTYLSPQIENTLGYNPEEAKVKWTQLITSNPMNQKGYELTLKAINTGEAQQPYELELKNKNGKKVYVEVREAPVVKNGKTTAIVGVLVDITERKKAQEKLLQNRFYLKKAQEMGKIGTWEFDIEKDILIWTEENYKIFEISRDTKLNLEVFFNRVHPEDRSYVQRRWEAALNKEPYEVEHRLLVNETVKWVKQKADVMFDSVGEPVKAIGFTQDITDRKIAEAKIHESEERYRLLYRNAGIGVGYYNPNGKIIDLNEIALNQLKKDKSEVIGKNLFDIFPEKDASLYLDRIKSTITNKKPQEFEDKVILNGRGRWFLSVYSCVKDLTGLITGVQIMSMEITKLKRTEQKLRRSEEKFKSYIQNAPDGVFLINGEGNFREVNAQAEFMTGYTQKELQKMNLPQLTPEDEKEFAANELHKLSENGLIRTELPFLTKAGEKRYWSIDAIQLSEDLFIAFKKDVTERIEYEQKIEEQNVKLEKNLQHIRKTTKELKLAKEKAEESDRLKSAFLANMSHEIRTPMNGILGFIDLLDSSDLPDDKKSEYLQMMQQSGDRLLNTINDIMEISKIEAGQMILNYSDENLKDIFKYLHNFFLPEAKGKGLFLNLSADINNDLLIRTDRTKLESILLNLIKNAIKFTKKGGVEFGVKLKDNQLEFYVSDTGIGIPEDRHQAVFDRFVQADLKISRPYEGSGLGLSIARAYAEMLGGKIQVTSEVGKGSTFSFVLKYAPVNKS